MKSKPTEKAVPVTPSGGRHGLWVGVLLAGLTVVAYMQVRNHEFVEFDDDWYVTENAHVQAGLTLEGVAWAFTTGHASNWHPLTWLSHMLDYQIFGDNAGGHHVTSLALHVANTLLVYYVFRRMTKAPWASAFVAALSAIHPLHVESVAWVSERKDVLSAFFWMVTMLAYTRYVERPGVARHLATVAAFALGLMAKPMLVTLPCVLLLLDYWPLGRVQIAVRDPLAVLRQYRKLILEKVPLFALTLVSSIVTVLAQALGGTVHSFERFSFRARASNAAVSYVGYLAKAIWPRGLAPFYPHPGDALPVWQAVGAIALLLCVSAFAVRWMRRRPYLVVGWLWYLGTLVPVIGIVQVGDQALADRYTYLPLIGLFILIAWGVPDAVSGWRRSGGLPASRRLRTILAASATISVLALTTCTWRQVRHWRDSVALFTHTLNVTSNNAIIHYDLGLVLAREGKVNQAMDHYSEAVRIDPGFAKAHYNLGNLMAKQGKLDEAIVHFAEAVRADPDHADAHNNLGIALAMQDKLDDAIAHFSEAVRINPDDPVARQNLEAALTTRASQWGSRRGSQ